LALQQQQGVGLLAAMRLAAAVALLLLLGVGRQGGTLI
jgi:hypothetical protein